MFHYTIFGGSEGEMSPRAFTSVTIYGFSRLRYPTVAQRILNLKRGEPRKPESWWQRMKSDRGLVLTVFGATEIAKPTVVEEYTAFRSLLAGGSITPEECRSLLERLVETEASDEYVTFTLFGSCYTKRVDAKAEAKALDTAEKAGVISPSQRRRLDQVVDAPQPTAIDLIGRLAAEAV